MKNYKLAYYPSPNPPFYVTPRKLEKEKARERMCGKIRRKKEKWQKASVFLKYHSFCDIFLISNSNFVRNEISF